MLSKDGTGPSTIVYQLGSLRLLDLLNVFLREQARFEIDIERLRTGEQPKKKKKIYENLDARLKRIVLSYDVNNIEEYLTRIAMNLKIGC